VDVGSTKSTTAKVKIANIKMHVGWSQVPSSQGEEAGTAKGMVSQTTPPFKTPEEDEQ
jgi:hypothetical protein